MNDLRRLDLTLSVMSPISMLVLMNGAKGALVCFLKSDLDMDSVASCHLIFNLMLSSKLIEHFVFSLLSAYIPGAQSPMPWQNHECYYIETAKLKISLDVFGSMGTGDVTVYELLDPYATFDLINYDMLL